MKLRLEKIASTRSGLVCGVLVKGPRDAWVRFALLEVPWNEVPEDAIDEYYAWRKRAERELYEDTPLAFE